MGDLPGKYVVGFLFNNPVDHVLLMRKTKPEWQKGYWNGLGGKIKYGEYATDAMEREAKEEANVDVVWSHFITLSYDDAAVHFLAAKDSKQIFDSAMAQTDEPLGVWPTTAIRYANVIHNLKFLIPMAAHHLIYEEIIPRTVFVRGKGCDIADKMKDTTHGK